MDAQPYFFRRTNTNVKGEARSWTDHLLWHHACHTLDLFMYQTGEIPSEVMGLQGPAHPDLGIAMDMTIGLKTPTGKLCSLSLSFNNDGPFGSFFDTLAIVVLILPGMMIFLMARKTQLI